MTSNNHPKVTGFPNMMNSLRPLLLGLTATVVLAGCPAAPPPPPGVPLAPEITAFTASSARVKAGTPVTLTWETKNASEVKIDNLALGVVSGVDGESGTVEVTVNESSVFVLSARNSRGVRESAAVAVEVEEGTREVLFAATPRAVAAGEPVTLAWIADGARSVSLRVKGGEALDVGDQLTAGHVSVRPTDDTTWEFTVDGTVFEAAVQVRPSILLVSSTPGFVLPGEDVTVQWVTLGASRVTVEAVGRGQVHETAQPGQVAEGSFTEQVAETVTPSDVVSYLVRAHGANDSVVTEKLELYVGGEPVVESFTAPEWVNEGESFPLTWRTVGADAVELTADGAPVYRSLTAAEAAQGTLTLMAPRQATTYRLKAIYARGGVAHSEPRLVSPVGEPQFVSFTASPAGIQTGGEPVTLSWNVANARNLRIEAVGGRTVAEASGVNAETGTTTVYPNKDTVYRLTADNAAGLSIPEEEFEVTVDTSATLTFSPAEVPLGGQIEITGASVPGVTTISGLPAVRNLPGTMFEDIALNDGVSLNYVGPDTTAILVQLPETFSMPYFDGTLSGDRLSVSINGWFAFSNSSLNGPDVATRFPSSALLPNAFGPLMEDLRDVNGELYYRLDTVNGVRRLIVQWDNVQIDLNGAAQNGTSLTFQAQLYADGRVVYAYGSLNGITIQQPSVGLQDGTMLRGLDAPVVPQSNETISFFHSAPVPVEIIAGTQPFTVTVSSPTFDLEVDSAAPLLPPGQITISEVNHNPAAGQQQWFEVRNNTATPRDLQGWTIDFGGGFFHEIATPVVLPANGFVVIGESASATEGGQVDYAYGPGLTFPAAAGSLGLGFAGVAYTRATWTAAGTAGVATQLDASPGLTMAGAPIGTGVTCAATQPYGAAGQLGTPGAAGTSCFPYAAQGASPHAFQSLLATGNTPTGFVASFDDERVAINLPRPIPLFGNLLSEVWISTNGFISTQALSSSSYPTNPTGVATGAPNGVLAPFWDDLVGRAGAGIRWQQFDPDGTPASGDEYTVFSWENATLYLQTATLNFQVRIDEATGDVHFLYGTMTSTDTGAQRARGSSATTIIENEAGSAALVHNLNSVSPGVPENAGLRFAFTP